MTRWRAKNGATAAIDAKSSVLPAARRNVAKVRKRIDPMMIEPTASKTIVFSARSSRALVLSFRRVWAGRQSGFGRHPKGGQGMDGSVVLGFGFWSKGSIFYSEPKLVGRHLEGTLIGGMSKNERPL